MCAEESDHLKRSAYANPSTHTVVLVGAGTDSMEQSRALTGAQVLQTPQWLRSETQSYHGFRMYASTNWPNPHPASSRETVEDFL